MVKNCVAIILDTVSKRCLFTIELFDVLYFFAETLKSIVFIDGKKSQKQYE